MHSTCVARLSSLHSLILLPPMQRTCITQLPSCYSPGSSSPPAHEYVPVFLHTNTFATFCFQQEGHKAFKAYLADLEELFLSRDKVTRQGTVLWDTTPIVFNKPEVTSEVRPDSSPSLSDIQVMINSVLERQAKSTDKLLRRLIKEWDGKKLMLLVLILLLLFALLVLLKPIHIQVIHRQAAH
jgi:hypothetical protein